MHAALATTNKGTGTHKIKKSSPLDRK